MQPASEPQGQQTPATRYVLLGHARDLTDALLTESYLASHGIDTLPPVDRYMTLGTGLGTLASGTNSGLRILVDAREVDRARQLLDDRQRDMRMGLIAPASDAEALENPADIDARIRELRTHDTSTSAHTPQWMRLLCAGFGVVMLMVSGTRLLDSSGISVADVRGDTAEQERVRERRARQQSALFGLVGVSALIFAGGLGRRRARS